MKSSSYLSWFRRLVVLGAVVAVGASASTAGAVGRPPDIQDIATANLAANVSRPPDIQAVASRLSASVPDVFERYAAAHPFGSGLSVYDAAVSRPPDVSDAASATQLAITDVFERYAAEHPYGRGLTVTPTLVTRPPDIQDTAASVNAASPPGSTLVSRPPDVTDTALTLQSSSSSQSNGFNWSDWGIGIGTGMGLALLLGFVLLIEQATAPPRAACLGSPPRTDRAGPAGPARSAEVGSSGLV